MAFRCSACAILAAFLALRAAAIPTRRVGGDLRPYYDASESDAVPTQLQDAGAQRPPDAPLQPHEGGRVVPYAPTRFGWGGGHPDEPSWSSFQRASRARRISSEAPPYEKPGGFSQSRARDAAAEFSAAPGRRSPPDWWETQPWWMRTLPWWLATPRATTLVRDPLEAEGSPKYLAPTRPFQGTGVLGGAAPGEGCRDATLPSGETCDHYLHVEAKGDRGAFVAKFCLSEAHSRTFAVACCVCGGGAGGDTLAASLPTKEKKESDKVPLPARELKQRLKDGDIEQHHDWSTPRAWLGGPPPNKDGLGTEAKDAKGWPLPKTMATKGQSFGGAMLERDGRKQPGPPR